MTFSNSSLVSQEIKIVTVDSPQWDVLLVKTEDIKDLERSFAREIGEKLYIALKPYFPAAGLAAPQIGISKSVFIYSYDRDPKNLEIVINPHFNPINEEKYEGWEGCLSVILSEGVWKVAQVPRYEQIEATYINLDGKKVEKILEGFAAKVFQHEYDHLQGIVNIYRADAEIKEFTTKEELLCFMQAVKKEDAARYKNPNEMA
jgi:peptide deformylase